MLAQDKVLYQREGAYLPRVAAVHDLCGYGKCSLGVAIPVLSCAGCDVCPVPTSLFSAHTKFDTFYMLDTTSMLAPYLDAWVEEGVELDAIYSGFLGAPEQVASILRLYREHPSALRVVDPVMGDGGVIYTTYTPELCDAMKSLVEGADILTPNLTEAAILTGTEYVGQNLSDGEVEALLDALLALGAKNVVVKGIDRGDGFIRNFVKGQDVALCEVKGELLPYMLHGTGDLYTSGLLAALMSGRNLEASVAFAGKLVHDAMVITREQPDYEVRGVSFESVLGDVTRLLA
jgi:pyridoxine kinase